jgi:hypothetical protein
MITCNPKEPPLLYLTLIGIDLCHDLGSRKMLPRMIFGNIGLDFQMYTKVLALVLDMVPQQIAFKDVHRANDQKNLV